eukprot:1683248-Lingulodinium_polyedra.AAC.1
MRESCKSCVSRACAPTRWAIARGSADAIARCGRCVCCRFAVAVSARAPAWRASARESADAIARRGGR